MKVIQFIAASAAAALKEIHAQLGPNAVVLSVRKLPAQGVARLWQKEGRIEVLAGVADESSEAELKNFAPRDPVPEQSASGFGSHANPSRGLGRWKTVSWLEAMGLMPAYAERLQNHLNALHSSAPDSLETEWANVNASLGNFWTDSQMLEKGPSGRPHVFIGPPGSGKTTVLCKWLTLTVLTEENSAKVWRLDSSIANTAEFLTVHCEMLDTGIERFWSPPKIPADLHFIDIPGVETDDLGGIEAIRSLLASLPSPHVHLVLNAAYETAVLHDQLRAFVGFEPEDLIFTHLDEETRRIKLWNFVFGTKLPIRFLSAGQKIPGEFKNASPELLLPMEFQRK